MKPCTPLFVVVVLLLLAPGAHAQRIWDVVVEPSNLRPTSSAPVTAEVKRGWLCYSGRTGRLTADCPVTFRLSGIGGPNVTIDCSPDVTSGRIAARTCGNGGHTHDETDRPIVYPGTEVEYGPAVPDNDPLFVSGPSPSSFNDVFSFTASEFGGIYAMESTMDAPLDSSFWTLANGVLFAVPQLTAEGRVNVTVAGDSLAQLPDLPAVYDKVRSQNSTAVTHTDAVAFTTTFQSRIALTAIARSFQTATGSNLSYNDGSLPKGGLFDFNAVHPDPTRTDTPWQKPHSWHRDGRDIDVNKPGGQSCTQNTSVQKAVDKILVGRGVAQQRSALICEVNNNGNYHIRITQLAILQAIQTILP